MKKTILILLLSFTTYISYGQVTPLRVLPCPQGTADCTGDVTVTAYRDYDGDGYGSGSSMILPIEEVTAGSGYSRNNLDCNDTNRLINPDTRWYLDNDGDGFGGNVSLAQCQSPSKIDSYVLISGDYDDTKSCVTNTPPITYYQDADGDGYGNINVSQICSTRPTGYVTNSSDCNDSNNLVNANLTWYLDNDKDGFGINNTATNKTQCNDPSTTSVKYLLTFGDLDDTKTCVTNIPPTTYYQDLDGDTYGNAKVAQSCSTQPAGYVTNADDADDANPNVTIVKINMTYDNAGNQLNRQFVVPTSAQSKLAATDRIDCLPNPVVDNAAVSWQLIGVKTMKSIRLYNDKGVLLQTFLGLEKVSTQAISFKNYAAGQYQLLLQYSDSTQKAITITKQ
jgi:hypothetical protein